MFPLCYPGAQMLTITPGKGSTFNISRSQDKGSGCTVCSGAGRLRECGPFALLRDNGASSVEFNCAKPHDIFSVEIVRNIGKRFLVSLNAKDG